MKIIDLSHPISPKMPVYPGSEPPVFINRYSIDDDGFLEKKITMYSHTGTHMDAPAHMIKGAKTLDQLPVEHFFGKAFIVDIVPKEKQPIGIDEFEPHQDLIKDSDFILLNTGFSQFWGSDSYFHNYPVLSSGAASWLSNFNLKGIGSDTISPDEIGATDSLIHKIFLSHNIVIIENLTNLNTLSGNPFTFSCFPLKIEQADGSPVRAVAII
ncbi:MAG: cyclase family protein [Thermodesulfobacteriota bacterium]|nr:cyclase family protein [Thermodesulfobacteriota bacterium]